MELEISHLSKNYKNKEALQNFNITLTPGIWGLLGANGAGKSTLIKLLSTVLRPTKGDVKFNGHSIWDRAPNYLRQLGVLPQAFGYYPNFRVVDFLQFMAAAKEIPARQTCNSILWALSVTNLSSKRDLKIKELSGGMRQRLGIAQALLGDPTVLILDEPTVGLDPEERIIFRKLLTTLAHDRIILLSTHIVQDVDAIADHLIVMESGQALLNGHPEELLRLIHGWVWECADIDDSQFVVSNIRHDQNGGTIYRVVSSQPPQPDAKGVCASLEDLYLYYFHQKRVERMGGPTKLRQNGGGMA